MRWRKWLGVSIVVVIGLAVAIPATLYLTSLDWSRVHTERVRNLPLFDDDQTGEVRIAAGGMEFRARIAGMQNDGDGVILVHGFPESSIMWEPLVERLAAAGYRVVAYDQRGYSPGARPAGRENYTPDLLADDIVAIADAVGFEDFHLVGHDWGAGAGWMALALHADRVRSWTGMSIPHLGAFSDALLNDPEQQQRSSYFDILRRPWLPEYMLTWGGQRRLEALLASLPDERREEYLAILAEPGALTAALNYYRAMDLGGDAQRETFRATVTTPTLFIWGNEDGVIARSSVAAQAAFLAGPYRELELDAGHGLLREEPEAVMSAILAHIDHYAAKPFDIDPDATLADSATTIVGINHVGLSVHDFETMLDFYRDATGFETIATLESDGDDAAALLLHTNGAAFRSATLRAPSLLFEITEFAGSRELPVETMPVSGPGMTHTCFQSPSDAPGYAKFVERGIRMLSRGDSPVDIGGYGVTYAYGYDPEGNMLELEQLDPAVIERIQDGTPWSTVEHPLWMTQVALVTDDLPRLVRFYEKVLGISAFRRVDLENRPKIDDVAGTDDVRISMAWFRLDRPNKVLELMQYDNPPTPSSTRAASPATPGYTFSFEVGDLDAEYERLRRLGVFLLGEPGELGAFRTVFAHDPDGNLFSLREPLEPGSAFSIRGFPFAVAPATGPQPAGGR